uniref:MORN repeat containing 1 n=2 Tax=Latimeria chalumnae TaxID=7897 RepID=H3AVE3_LATCH
MASLGRKARNSNFYIGEMKEQMRDGFGLYVYSNNFFRYEGEWMRGKKHGHGKLVMKDGSFYEGQFENGEINGNGFRFWAATGNSYSGQFHFGELHGYGVMKYGIGGKYEGEFSYGMQEGHGVLMDREGQTFQGSFHNNKRHGEGKITFLNGDQYEGDWVMDQRQGHGVLCCADGSVYEGQWRNDVFGGQGTMIHCSGVVYDGLWINGRPSVEASKMVIIEGAMIEVLQGALFTIQVQLQDEEGNVTSGENGREIRIWAGVQCVPPPVDCTTSFLALIQDLEEKPVMTPFGYECVSYPLL